MDAQPKASVVIPAFRAAESVGEAIDSVRAALDHAASQLGMAGEVIVVDDASPDETATVVRGRGADDPRVRLVSLQENGGPCVARNRGVEAARGDYVLFLDADDVYLPEHVAVCVGALEGNPNLGYVYTRMKPDGHIHPDWIASISASVVWTLCLRRMWHMVIGGFLEHPDWRRGADDSSYRALLREACHGVALPQETVLHRQRSGGHWEEQARKFSMSRADWRAMNQPEAMEITPRMMEEFQQRRQAVIDQVRALRGLSDSD